MKSVLKLLLCVCLVMNVSEAKQHKHKQPVTQDFSVLSDSNADDFAAVLIKDYIMQLTILMTKYALYEKNNNAHGFVMFRLKQFEPAFNKKQEYYETILNKNRLYLVEQGKLQELIICFENLKLRSINLMTELNHPDLANKQYTKALIKQDYDTVKNYIDVHNLKPRLELIFNKLDKKLIDELTKSE